MSEKNVVPSGLRFIDAFFQGGVDFILRAARGDDSLFEIALGGLHLTVNIQDLLDS